MPATLKALLAARLDQLEAAERGVLERGAVEGELFHRGAVQALAPDEARGAARLTALVRKELIRPDRPLLPAEDGFRFCHLLIRDAAYDALPKATRAELHERFAALARRTRRAISSSATRSSATTWSRPSLPPRARPARRGDPSRRRARRLPSRGGRAQSPCTWRPRSCLPPARARPDARDLRPARAPGDPGRAR